MTDFLQKLERLAKAATKRPWKLYGDEVCFKKQQVVAIVEGVFDDGIEAATNAALIVHLRNHVPAILALGRERDALRSALEIVEAAEPSDEALWRVYLAAMGSERGKGVIDEMRTALKRDGA